MNLNPNEEHPIVVDDDFQLTPPPNYPYYESINGFLFEQRERLASLGWYVEHSDTYIKLYRKSSNGFHAKHPEVILDLMPGVSSNMRHAVMKWVVNSRDIYKETTELNSALELFFWAAKRPPLFRIG